MLDPHQLNVFLTAAETLSFTKAAEKLHMSQPSVSQHIQSLEARLGCSLFLRGTRKLTLTDAGTYLVPMAQRLVSNARAVEEEMAAFMGKVIGHLIVGCSTTPGKYLLPHLLTAFHHQYPLVSVTCQVTSQLNAIELLCNGETHFALTSANVRECPTAEMHYFTSDPVVLIAPADHPFSQAGCISPEVLYEGRFIMRENTSGTYRACAKKLHLAGVNIEALPTILTLGNSEAIALAVAQGLGVGFVSHIVVEQLKVDNVRIVSIEGLEICRDIYIARAPKYSPTRVQQAFWEFITQLPTPFMPTHCTSTPAQH